MNRPVIGVTTSHATGWRVFPLMRFNLWLAGARAVRWASGWPADMAAVDGILVGGGDDVSPDLYGGQIIASARLDPARDAMERDLIRDAYNRNKPVMGICRGSQMLNIALGGTLHQDAYGIYEKSRKFYTPLPRKTVRIEPGTRLMALTGDAPMKVNALHSQAVNALGRGLRVAARDEGGMIQAIERLADPFCIGVQWHPEQLFYARRQRALFRALVDAARAGMAGEPQAKAVTP
ncbi:gamma-glutamyl-gamma-aminobutyrate hydrolase family protein [Oceaniglobus ichthyenteri]|uniref:gamma-glutamyl-gamma-aminobutyrate hydrolase family protein n=1 Tax=Oceaniglobus ichthyenteri TaxID=2136177 RepID=UPI000D3AF56A|nr:gamma-glutamyl-gamma-aminobutyrate hydrolase family protein [Oceaniglobus ichthyenteri]